MAKRLLDRQIRLLEYLTSGGAIFGDDGNAPLDADLQGIDRARLRLEARFSHEKRMEKIAAVFPRTFDLLGAERGAIVRGFVEACPPLDIGRMENARQFNDFLTARWRVQRPTPPYLPDVAACELACAQARIESDGEPEIDASPAGPAAPRFRRKPGVVLVRASFDIRMLFEGARDDAAVIKRDTPLAIASRDGAPQIFELAPEVFDLLAALDGWAAVDSLPETDGLIAELVDAGLLELQH